MGISPGSKILRHVVIFLFLALVVPLQALHLSRPQLWREHWQETMLWRAWILVMFKRMRSTLKSATFSHDIMIHEFERVHAVSCTKCWPDCCWCRHLEFWFIINILSDFMIDGTCALSTLRHVWERHSVQQRMQDWMLMNWRPNTDSKIETDSFAECMALFS